MTGLVPVIHAFISYHKDVDGRDKHGHDVIGDGRRGKALGGKLWERPRLTTPTSLSVRPVHPQHHGLRVCASRCGMLGGNPQLLMLHDMAARIGEREGDRAPEEKRREDRGEKPIAFGKLVRDTLLADDGDHVSGGALAHALES
jgi:hypothetical protein